MNIRWQMGAFPFRSLRNALWVSCIGVMVCQTALAQDKVALVVGNADYANGPDLATPIRDSGAVAAALDRLGYYTILLQNIDKSQMMIALAELRLTSVNADQVLIYFAGHGVQRAGESLLLTSDSRFDGADSHTSMVPMRVLIKAISDRARQKIVFVDACRDNPVYHGAHQTRSSSNSEAAPAGLFILYASQAGTTAFDGQSVHSPFAQAFLDNLPEQTDVEEFARRIRVDVIRSTQGVQIPWSQSSLVRPAILH